MHVPLETLRRAAQLIDSLADVDLPSESSELVLPGLTDLVGCDVITYNEIGVAPGQVSYYADYPSGCLDPASLAVFEAHLHEHPLLVHYRATGDGEPAKISDLLSRRQFHRLGIYSEFFRHVPVEDQIAFTLPSTGDDQIVAIALNRSREDFTDADREVLIAIAGPLSNALWRARRRNRAHEAMTTASPGGPVGLADLTDRELQVLRLAAEGRTNQAIARAIDVSPRTIAKHLEHIYRKLGVANRAAAVYATATAAPAGPAPAT